MEKMSSETHPSFGVVQVSRVTGGERYFFGSSYKPQHYYQISIHGARREVNHFGDVNYYPKHKLDDENTYFQIRLTPHQFSEMLTMANVGSGVPCTIEYGKPGYHKVEQVESEKTVTDIDTMIAAAKEKMQEHIDKAKAGIAEMLLEVEEMKIAQKNKDAIYKILQNTLPTINSNGHFWMKQIQEVAEKQVAEAKANIDAAITGTLMKLGERALGQEIAKGKGISALINGGSDGN